MAQSAAPSHKTYHVLLRHDRFGRVCERIHRHHSAAERPVGFQPGQTVGAAQFAGALGGGSAGGPGDFIAYGARHGLKERKRPRPKLNKLKKRSSGVGEAAGDA